MGGHHCAPGDTRQTARSCQLGDPGWLVEHKPLPPTWPRWPLTCGSLSEARQALQTEGFTKGSMRWLHTLLVEASLWSPCLLPEGFTTPPAFTCSSQLFGSYSSGKHYFQPASPGPWLGSSAQSQRTCRERCLPAQSKIWEGGTVRRSPSELSRRGRWTDNNPA